VRRLLGSDAHRLFNGLLMTSPGASEQLWHADGEHLFSSTHPVATTEAVTAGQAGPTACPSGGEPLHCLNVFVPLVDLTMANGVTEFLLGSQAATALSPEVVWQDNTWKERIGYKDAPGVCLTV